MVPRERPRDMTLGMTLLTAFLTAYMFVYVFTTLQSDKGSNVPDIRSYQSEARCTVRDPKVSKLFRSLT